METNIAVETYKKEAIIYWLQNASKMQLHMGELDENELLVAKSAVRYTLSQLLKMNVVDIEKMLTLLSVKVQ